MELAVAKRYLVAAVKRGELPAEFEKGDILFTWFADGIRRARVEAAAQNAMS